MVYETNFRDAIAVFEFKSNSVKYYLNSRTDTQECGKLMSVVTMRALASVESAWCLQRQGPIRSANRWFWKEWKLIIYDGKPWQRGWRRLQKASQPRRSGLDIEEASAPVVCM